MQGNLDHSEERRRFEVGPCVGRGGFGEVYLATMVSGGGVRSEVALKVLHTGLDPRSQAVQRLADEAKLLGVLNHPSILRIHDLVLLDGRITLVTEYVAGADLDQCTQGEHPLSTRALLQVMTHVAAALHTAYTTLGSDGQPLHLLHRDIKPSNIRVGRHGEVKLLDFGIAKAAGERVAKTQTNAIIGSFSYMSPERLDREGNDDAPGDVFAMGCALYESLHGEQLFDGSIRELYRMSMLEERHQAHVAEGVAALDAPEPLRALLLELLAYAPSDRPQLMPLAERLEDLADDMEGLTLARWSRAHPWIDAHEPDGELTGRSITESNLSQSMLDAQVTAEVEKSALASGSFSAVPAAPEPSEENSDTFAWNGPPAAAEESEEGAPPPPPAPRKSRWLVATLAIVAVVMLGIGVSSILLVGGMAWFAGGSTEPVAAAAPEPAQAVVEEAPAPVVQPVTEQPPQPSSEPTPAPAGTSGPTVDETDGAADATAPASAEEPCGPIAELEVRSLAGTLSPRAARCLTKAMTDPELSQVQRDRLGRLLIVDRKARCDATGSCGEYEAAQRTFFEEVTRSDAEMLFAFGGHLAASATTDDRRREALLWSNRALDLRRSWTGLQHVKRVDALYQRRAEVSYAIWQGDHRDNRARVLARNASVEWMNQRIQLKKDHSAALALCASVEGSEEVCLAKAHDVGATYVITFVSEPPGAQVLVDGKALGSTPFETKLAAGTYQAQLVLGALTTTHSLQIDSGKPTRFTWQSQSDEWASAF